MRILILHQNSFEQYEYDIAIDHEKHEVTYAGLSEHILRIPKHIRCEKMIWKDSEPVLDQLRSWMKERKPYEKIINRFEYLMLTAAILREEFSIPGMMPNIATNFRDKVQMKKKVENAGLRVPQFFSVKECPNRAPWIGKTILKPRSEGASQGITLFDSYSEAQEFISNQDASAKEMYNDHYEVEEYLEGDIWHIDGYIFEKKIIAIQSSYYIGTLLSYQNNGTPIGSVQKDNPELDDWALKCLLSLEADSLTFHMEAIMTVDGPVFLEVGARCGGAYVADVFRLRQGIYLHNLDIASDVEGALATRFTNKILKDKIFGWFLFPGHIYGESPCEVHVSNTILEDTDMVEYKMLSPETPTRNKGTYQPHTLPFAGIVSSDDSESLDSSIKHIFNEVSVTVVSA